MLNTEVSHAKAVKTYIAKSDPYMNTTLPAIYTECFYTEETLFICSTHKDYTDNNSLSH